MVAQVRPRWPRRWPPDGRKKGAIADKLPGILQRLDMDAKQFIYLTRNFEHPFKNLVGAAHHVRKACESIGQNWVHGMSQCETFFSSS